MVHVEVDHGHALQVVALQGVLGGNGHIVEEAKTHGLVVLGVVPGRAHAAEGVLQLAGHDGIHRIDRRASSTQGRRPSVAVHGGVGVELEVGRTAGFFFLDQAQRHTAHGGHMHAVVRQLDVGQGGQRRFAVIKGCRHAGDQQPVFDGIQARGAFRVSRPHLVFAAVAMCVIARLAHSQSPVYQLFSDNVGPCMHSTRSNHF